MKILKTNPPPDRQPTFLANRRKFLKYSGFTVAAAGLIIAGCDDDDDDNIPDLEAVDLGSGDIGILNYAYALEQVESAFYAEVLRGGYYGNAPAAERQILDALNEHEQVHADFFRTAIASVGEPIPALQLDFSNINFNDRASVLTAAQTFEDLGVAAYNGAGPLLTNADFLLIAGKIVSVEARHAAAIRSLSTDVLAFAGDDIIDANGLDIALSPSQVLQVVSPFLQTPLDARNLPV